MGIKYLKRSVKKDETGDNEIKDLFRHQFAKAYYNVGLISDKDGDT